MFFYLALQLCILDTIEIGHLGCPDVCVASERIGRVDEEKKKEEEAKWPGGHTAY